MPYIIIKCEAGNLATGNSYFGDEKTDQEIVNYVKILSGGDITDSMRTVSGFYEVEQPVCWLLNTLENIGYTARSTPVLNNGTFYWFAQKGHRVD